MNPAKKICSTIVALVLVFCAMPFSQAQAANDPETLFYVEDLGNGITVETTITIYPGVTRNQSTSAISSSEFKQWRLDRYCFFKSLFHLQWYYCGCNRYRILEKPCKRLELYQPQNHND